MPDSALLFLAIAIVLLLALILMGIWIMKLRNQLAELSFKKSSQSVKYGKLTEQWIPFSKEFPHNPAQFRFLGDPIDGIVFGDNEITFTEFKTASSQLSPKQRRIRELVEQGKINWLEFKIK